MRLVVGIVAMVSLFITITLATNLNQSLNLMIFGPAVATGIGAKLLCSAEYVMGSDRQQAFEDVAQYSPILGKLSVRYDESLKGVTTSLLGITEATAVFKEGIGCAIEYPDVVARYQVSTRPLQTSGEPWPQGSAVSSLKPELQNLIETQLSADNAQGLNTRALLVVHNGEIVAEAYGQGATPSTPLLGWSMAAPSTATGSSQSSG